MSEAMSFATEPVTFAATDMLHRRIELPHRFELVVGGLFLLIKTDSMLMEHALNGLLGSIGSIAAGDSVEWEIAVEVHIRTERRPVEARLEACETYSFGPSRSLRMNTGSWFAHTPPSLSGVGFAFVTGNECHQTRQLASYLKTILRFLDESGIPSAHAIECEVPA